MFAVRGRTEILGTIGGETSLRSRRDHEIDLASRKSS